MEYTDRLGHAYFFAKNYIIRKGYWDEINWQDSVTYSSLTQQKFLEEAAWVILASGLSDKVVRKKFPLIQEKMFKFSAALIVKNRFECYEGAIRIFNHPGKINAILSLAHEIVSQTFESIKRNIDCSGIQYLKTFSYIGDATAYHLAKNIGLRVAKPDRHLNRISSALGFQTPMELCETISDKLQENVSLVDLVLWRYATLDKNYLLKIKRFLT